MLWHFSFKFHTSENFFQDLIFTEICFLKVGVYIMQGNTVGRKIEIAVINELHYIT
jgi:hypothetical protein